MALDIPDRFDSGTDHIKLIKGVLDMENVRKLTADQITKMGNPGKPNGEAGKMMLERMNSSHSELTDWALELINFDKDDHVLDIGCGGGSALNKISKRVTSGYLYGVDHSEISVLMTENYNSEIIRKGRMNILRSSVEKLPFLNAIFDKIITVESFYFWPDPLNNLKEVRRTLKPAGKFFLVSEIFDQPDLPKEVQYNIKKYNLYNPDIQTFEELFCKAGFKEVNIHTRESESWICVEGIN